MAKLGGEEEKQATISPSTAMQRVRPSRQGTVQGQREAGGD